MLPLTVKEGGLDENGHVNNVTYVRWAEEAVKGQAGFRPKRMQADYLGEALLGDRILMSVWDRVQGRRFVEVALVRGRPVCVLQWR